MSIDQLVNSRSWSPTSNTKSLLQVAILVVISLLAGNSQSIFAVDQTRSDQWGLGTDQPVPGDYDGDARTDLAVFRPSEGCWYIFNSANATFKREPFGVSTDQPVAADYDGDGRIDIAVFRPSNGVWYYLKSSNGSFQFQQFGATGDIPVAGDFNGDGRSDYAVWRPSTGYWYTSLNAATNYGAIRLGQVGDIPVQADYDGDGKTDATVFRPSTGTFYIWQSSVNSLRTRQWGTSTDRPLAGDFDKDGKADIGVFRPIGGTWYVLKSIDSTLFAQPWGQSSDRLIPNDYDGNRQTDMAVFSQTGGIWNILLNPVPLTVPDTTPPVISGVSSAGMTSSTASILWTTDEASDTQVEYGTSTSYGSSSVLNSSLVTSHNALLGGLSASTLYHYRVKSRDAAGNLASSGDFTFSTSVASGPITMGQTSVLPTDDSDNANLLLAQSATLSTTATLQSLSFYVTTASGNLRLGVYDATGPSGGPGNKLAETNGFAVTSGWNTANVTTPVAIPAGTYWIAYMPSSSTLTFKKSTVAGVSGRFYAYAYGAMPATFSTTPSTTTSHWSLYAMLNGAPPPPDTTPPVISSVASSGISSSGATITWTTDEVSDTQVEYGTTTSYGSSTTLNSSLVTSHSASIGGLSASTLYHYRVKSRDASSNLATSGDFTFTTAVTDTTPPVISAVVSSGISSSGATITWSTNEASDTQVEYGTTTSYGSSSALNATLVTSHSATLSGLSVTTLYHYRVKSRDAAGNLATSGDFTFTTTNSSCPGFIIEGLGRNTIGGCGGTVYTVTNLNDSGPGSLREFAQNRTGPRMITFSVSGTVTLLSDITINYPFVTIDGSTAPNQGIALKGGGIDIRAWEVILRNFRIRPGTQIANYGSSNAVHVLRPEPGIWPPSARTYNVVLDHMSLSWSTDQNLGSDGENMTVQWCIISELLEGSGSVLIFYGNPSHTFHHNLFANSGGARQPEIGNGDLDWVNNVVYRNFDGRDFYGLGLHLFLSHQTAVDPGCSLDPGDVNNYCNGPNGFTEGGPVHANFVGNLYLAGPLEVTRPTTEKQIHLAGARRYAAQSSVYVQGNIAPERSNNSLPETAIIYQADAGRGYTFPLTTTRHSFAPVTTTTAAQSLIDVLAGAGARLPCLDSVDRRVISDVTNGTGTIISNPNSVGGYPNLTLPCN